MNHHHRLSALAALALVSSALVAPPLALGHGNQVCLDGNKVNGLLSGDIYNSSVSVTGVVADIDFKADTCDGNDDDHMTAAWVGLVPDNAQGTSIIIQAGILACKESSLIHTVCTDHPDTLRYFFAYGGCTQVNGPYGRDAGAATWGTHRYRVDRDTDGWRLYLPNGNSYFISAGNVAVSCIGSGIQTQAQWGVEKWDRGDSSGGPTTKTHYSQMQNRHSGLWYLQAWGALGNCQKVMSTAPHDSGCWDKDAEMWAWD